MTMQASPAARTRAVQPAAPFRALGSSRRRLLAHLRARDAEGAALEMEAHLRALHYMWRLANSG